MAKGIVDHLKLLADESRLRLLGLLQEEELSVNEMVAITGMGQSRVSRHLGVLRSAGVVSDRREGTWSYYRLVTPRNGNALTQDLWHLLREPLADTDQAAEDRAGLERVRAERRERSRSSHDALAGVWRVVGENLERGSLRAEALAALAARDLVVADLGCGAGFVTSYLGGRVARVIAVDHSPAMLDEARQAVGDAGEVEFRHGDIESLPIADGEVDAVVANMVLHHLADFGPALSEIERILRPGGVAVVSDLRPHSEDWMRDEMGDLRLGIDPEELGGSFRTAGFAEVEELLVEDRYQMRSEGGRNARLELFFIRARKEDTKPRRIA